MPTRRATARSIRARWATGAPRARGTIGRGASKGGFRGSRVGKERTKSRKLVKRAQGDGAGGANANTFGNGSESGAVKVLAKGIDRGPGDSTIFKGGGFPCFTDACGVVVRGRKVRDVI